VSDASEWVRAPLGQIASIAIGGTPARDNANYWASAGQEGHPWVSIADLGPRFITDTKEQITDDGVRFSNVKPVAKDTLLLSFKLTIGRAGIAGRDLYTNEAIAAIRPLSAAVSSKFLYYALPSVAKNAVTDTAIKGVTLNKQKLASLIVSLPSEFRTQQSIADILETIDIAIEKTESLIAKYQQIKAGLMHDLFTRGVTADGKLRPPREQAPELYHETPIGWIPKEWSIGPLSSCTQHDITYGIVQAGPHIEGGIPYIRTGDMAGDRLERSQLLCTSPTIAAAYKRSEVRAGEIVCAIRATVGKVLEVPSELDGANLTQGTARLSPSTDIDRRFLLWVMRSSGVQRSISQRIKGTTFSEITLGELRSLPIPRPSMRVEQTRIGERLDEIDSFLQTEKAVLTKLLSKKRGLMHDLLTGRVQVKAS
jgi:type I restriction enzyme S subunit